MNERFLSMLGLACRAGKIQTGEMVIQAIRAKKAKLVIIASDASENTRKKLEDKCTFYEVPFAYFDGSERLSAAIGRHNRMAVAVMDDGFARNLIQLMKG